VGKTVKRELTLKARRERLSVHLVDDHLDEELDSRPRSAQ
jgi:hypothetical protein